MADQGTYHTAIPYFLNTICDTAETKKMMKKNRNIECSNLTKILQIKNKLSVI